MLYGYQEWITIVIGHPVASAVVLNLDDDALKLTDFVVHQKRPEQGIILSEFALVANEDRHDTAGSPTISNINVFMDFVIMTTSFYFLTVHYPHILQSIRIYYRTYHRPGFFQHLAHIWNKYLVLLSSFLSPQSSLNSAPWVMA